MKSFLVAIALMFGFASSFSSVQAAEKQKILVQLQSTTNDLHATFMAVKLAHELVKKKQEVTLFVNLEGVRIADKRQPINLRWGMNDITLEEVYQGFVKDGGKVLVCPHCAMAAGLTKENLREGATIGTVDDIANAIIASDKILDY